MIMLVEISMMNVVLQAVEGFTDTVYEVDRYFFYSLFYSGFRGSRGSSFSIVPSEDAEEVSILLSSISLSTNG